MFEEAFQHESGFSITFSISWDVNISQRAPNILGLMRTVGNKVEGSGYTSLSKILSVYATIANEKLV